MRKVWIASTLLFLLCGSQVVSAQPATPVPDVKPDFSPMMFYIGTWTCHTKLSNRPGDRVEKTTTRLALDDRYLYSHRESPSFDAARTRTVTSEDYMTYDAKLKRWVYFDVDNFGSYFVATSPGWNGNTITWTATVVSGGDPPGTYTETKTSDTATHGALTVNGVQMWTNTCAKS